MKYKKRKTNQRNLKKDQIDFSIKIHKAIKKKSMSQTHLVKKLSAMLFLKKKFNSGNELSPMRFFIFLFFFYSQGSNVYVLCDIQKQKH